MSQRSGKRANENSEGTDASTRGRLLDVAERLFAAHGFRDASVRQITAEAGANPASVNYHFGGKDQLYVEVMRRSLEVFLDGQLQAIRSVMADQTRTPTVESLVRAFTRAWLSPVTSGDEHIVQLSFRERADRRLPDDIVRDRMQAVEDSFTDALCRLTEITAEAAAHCVRCFEVLLNGLLPEAMSNAISRGGPISDDGLDELVEHVILFGVAGINGLAKSRGSAANRRNLRRRGR